MNIYRTNTSQDPDTESYNDELSNLISYLESEKTLFFKSQAEMNDKKMLTKIFQNRPFSSDTTLKIVDRKIRNLSMSWRIGT